MKNCIAQEHLISSNPNSSKARTSICSQTSTYNFNHFPCLCSLPKLRPKNQCQSPAATHTHTRTFLQNRIASRRLHTCSDSRETEREPGTRKEELFRYPTLFCFLLARLRRFGSSTLARGRARVYTRCALSFGGRGTGRGIDNSDARVRRVVVVRVYVWV